MRARADAPLDHVAVRLVVFVLGSLVACRYATRITSSGTSLDGGFLEHFPADLVRSYRHGVLGHLIGPIGIALAAPAAMSRDVVRTGIAVALIVPAARYVVVGQVLGAGWSIGCAAVVAWVLLRAARVVRRSDDLQSYRMLATGVVLGAMVTSALALSWWWPPSLIGTPFGPRLEASPYFVVATTFFSFALRDSLLRRARAAGWALVGHLALGLAPHLGTVGCGCMTCPGPGVIPDAWLLEAVPFLGLLWSPIAWSRFRAFTRGAPRLGRGTTGGGT